MTALVALGVFLFTTGLFSQPLVADLISEQVAQMLRLDNADGQFFKAWSDPASGNVSVYLKFVVWNITNPDAVIAGHKPELQLVGPFSYLETRAKFDLMLDVDSGGDTIYYKERLYYNYVDTPCWPGANISDLCSLSEDTPIVTFNGPLIGVVNQLRALAPKHPAAIEAVLALLTKLTKEKEEQLMLRRTASEIVWGYDDGLLEVITKLVTLAATFGVDLHIALPGSTAMLQNNSLDGRTKPSAVRTGKSNITRVGEFVQWQGHAHSLPFWNGCDNVSNARANMINGTEGIQFGPGLNTNSRLQVFTDEVVRTLPFLVNHTLDGPVSASRA